MFFGGGAGAHVLDAATESHHAAEGVDEDDVDPAAVVGGDVVAHEGVARQVMVGEVVLHLLPHLLRRVDVGTVLGPVGDLGLDGRGKIGRRGRRKAHRPLPRDRQARQVRRQLLLRALHRRRHGRHHLRRQLRPHVRRRHLLRHHLLHRHLLREHLLRAELLLQRGGESRRHDRCHSRHLGQGVRVGNMLARHLVHSLRLLRRHWAAHPRPRRHLVCIPSMHDHAKIGRWKHCAARKMAQWTEHLGEHQQLAQRPKVC